MKAMVLNELCSLEENQTLLDLVELPDTPAAFADCSWTSVPECKGFKDRLS